MSRTAYKFSAVIVSLLVTAALSACGTDKKEGNATPANVPRVADEATCRVCHAASIDPASITGIVADFLTTSNSHNQPGRTDTDLGCQGCHGGGAQHNGIGPIPFNDPLNVTNPDGTTTRCIVCHTTTAGALAPTTQNLNALFDLAKPANGGFVNNNCAHCHTDSRVGSVHGAKVPETADCVFCHDVAAPQHGPGRVGDNVFKSTGNGVRSITGISGEFGANTAKKSHHIVNSDGSDPTAAQCLGCHAEGTVVNGVVTIDENFHMKDGNVYLRNGGGIPAAQLAKEIGGNKSTTIASVSVFPWNPATPDHSLMDQFCFSCHNANGAPLAGGIGNTAGNPFNDAITNGYDQMSRGRVVNVFGQFSTGNASHHAVRGKRYTGNSRLATGTGVRQIATPATFANNSGAAFNGVNYPDGKSGPGKRSTLFDAGFFATAYVPLGAAATQTLGDDSTLHCGDCHTVGQWKPNSALLANGTATTPVAIGAHGSANEYMLRNSKGSDELHNGTGIAGAGAGNFATTFDITTVPSLVCFNCHAYSRYGAFAKHEGVNSTGDCNDDQWTFNSAGQIGALRVNRTGNASTWGAPSTWGNGAGGNILGIQCANCHNSGADARFGGIHGGNITYVDGTGVSQKPYRFLPGLGNVKYAPNNHLRNDGRIGLPDGNGAALGTNTPELTTTWEERTLYTGSRATCYTLNNATNAPGFNVINSAGEQVIGTWGACTDHGGSSIGGGHGGTSNTFSNNPSGLRDVQRPLTY